MTFEYDQGRSHTQASGLGVGLSGYGIDAGYNAQGTNVSSATRSEGYANEYGSSWFRTLFRVGQYRGECYAPNGATHITHLKQHGYCPLKFYGVGGPYKVHKCFWAVASRGWFGGTSTKFPKHAPPTSPLNCAPHEPNSHYNDDLGTAVDWSSGFKLGASADIKNATLKAKFNGSAQTGYDVNAKMYFHFGRYGGELCGTNGSEATAAILVEGRR